MACLDNTLAMSPARLGSTVTLVMHAAVWQTPSRTLMEKHPLLPIPSQSQKL